MRFGWMVVAWLVVGRSVAAADVSACLAASGSALTYGATRIASAVLQKAGVAVEWQCPAGRPLDVSRTWLRIELVEGSSDPPRPGVLGVSYPHTNCARAITVHYDRVRALARSVNDESTLLAYVLVHEIAHVIQGVNRHSSTGVMKSSWSEADRAAMIQRRLEFEDVDVRLLQRGLAAGVCGEPTRLVGRAQAGDAGAIHRE
jgi:hypothetical protein